LRWPDIVLDLADMLPPEPAGVYLVGGAVRDALLGRPIKDVDIATTGSGTRLARAIANQLKGDFYPLDPDRDVGRALVDTPEGRLIFDVASLRGPDILADLLDRDFTLNAMAVDLRGDLNMLIDPLGGEKDAITRLVRQCGPASLTSDPLRTLRAVRQSMQLKAHIEKETLGAIRASVPLLPNVSPERIRDEFMRILALGDVAGALRVADVLSMLKIILPDVQALRGVKQPADAPFDLWAQTLNAVTFLSGIFATISPQRTDETAADFSYGMIVMALDRFRRELQQHIDITWADGRSHRSLLMLAILYSQVALVNPSVDAEALATSLRLSNAEQKRLVAGVRHQGLPFALPELTPINIHRFWRTTGESGVDVLLLALARYLGRAGAYLQQDDWIAFLEQVRVLLDAWYIQYATLVEPPLLVDGKQLMSELKLKSGPMIGRMLDTIREAQVNGDVTTADDALALARRVAEAS
jgi:tRNA nucleotidyltransferase/poly(A) polymerase